MRAKKLAIGLMTGSSMDGIDGAILETDGLFQIKHITGVSYDYSVGFKKALRLAEYAMQQENGDMVVAATNFATYLDEFLSSKEIADIIAEFDLSSAEQITFELIIVSLTKKHADLVYNLLRKSKLNSADIDVIGFHGQNLYHNPTIKTVQVGDGQLLANLTGIVVVNNFRQNDVQYGGQGAPFAPLYHFALAGNKGMMPVALVNCGGIANITFIYDNNPSNMIAYDTGPGNVLVDRYIRKVSNDNEYMDKDGQYGKKGNVDQDMLEILRKEAISNYPGEFLTLIPPKSLDTRHFKLPDQIFSLSKEDACATLEYFTAECIVSSLELLKQSAPKRYVLGGGGWKNPVIYGYLAEMLRDTLGPDCEISHADDIGWSGQFMEAEIFAYLAVRNINNESISLPNITGASRPTISDSVFSPTI